MKLYCIILYFIILIIISLFIFRGWFIHTNKRESDFIKYLKKNFRKYIILSILSNSFTSLSENLYNTFTTRFNINNHLYLSFDFKSYKKLGKIIKYNLYFYKISSVTNSSCYYGTKCYGYIIQERLNIIHLLLKMNYSVLILDPDVFFFKNPLSYFMLKSYDIIATCDRKEIMNAGFLYNS